MRMIVHTCTVLVVMIFLQSQEMFHAHTMESMLISKYDAIMACFLQSSAPPKLQVDVPLSVAEELARKPHGPYLFREAQARTYSLYNSTVCIANNLSSVVNAQNFL